MTRIAIVGGGPGGPFTAYLLETYFPSSLEPHCAGCGAAPLSGAGPPQGAKAQPRPSDAPPAPCEAGVAEFYDYAQPGPAPLKQLVKPLGLPTVRMSGPAVILGDAIL